MQNKFTVILVLGAILLANGLAWLTQPSAIPAHPADIFPSVAQSAEGSEGAPEAARPLAKAASERSKSNAPAVSPLQLTLETEAPVNFEHNSKPELALEETPFLHLETDRKRVVRADVPKIKLFDPDTGTRGFSSRRWLSDNLGLEAGIGLTDAETLRDREAAAGVGMVLSFD